MPRRNGPIAWTAELAYLVGLKATDGNLSGDGRHLTLVSADLEMLETVRECLHLHNRLGRTSSRNGPVPAEEFHHFLRGCIDGDGSIVSYIDRYNTAKNPAYVYRRLYVSLVSASAPFVDWVRTRIWELRGLRGRIAAPYLTPRERPLAHRRGRPMVV